MTVVQGTSPVSIFQGGSDGYGYAVAELGRDTYHWTYNWDCRTQSRAAPALAPILIMSQFDGGSTPATFLFEWTDTSGTPLLIFPRWGEAATESPNFAVLKDGTVTSETSFSVRPAFTAGVLYRYDFGPAANADAEVAWFCNGATANPLVSRTKAAVTKSDQSATADLLAVVGSDLWRSKGYKISKLILDQDPGLEASWGPAEIPVGVPSWPINAIINLGGSAICLKGDGFWRYNPIPSVAEFLNITPSLSPHPDNGKGSFTDGRGRIYFPTVDGDLLVITFGGQSQQRPARLTKIDRDTNFGRITALTAAQEYVYAATAPGYRAATGVDGMKVFSHKVGVYTDITTAMTDKKYSTTVSLFGYLDTDEILVGLDSPFLGIDVKLGAQRSSAITGSTTTTVVSYDSAGGWQVCNNTIDGTGMFIKDGLLPLCQATDASGTPTLPLEDATNPWIKTTIQGELKYWAKFAQPGTGPLAGATIREIGIVPYRQPLDKAVHPTTAYAIAGCFPKILTGTWRGEDIVWHDVWTLRAGPVDRLAVSRVGYTGKTTERALFASATSALYAMPVGADGIPAAKPWAKLADYGESGIAFDEHLLVCSGNDFGLPENIKRVETVVVEFPYVQSDDLVFVYSWWDEDAENVERYGPFSESSVIIEGIVGEGRTLYMAVALVDAARDVVAPQIPSITVPGGQWEYEIEHFMLHRADQQAIPRR